ncbi:MAG: hypothetical protein EXR50_04365 [Dehalococcoidia bacterium]|nr:hypothetical protein [Dehalococcoidia bacterium]
MWKIIPLDQRDTFPSIRAKINRAQSESIALVLPLGFELFKSLVYLTLLRRLMDSKQCTIALISSEGSILRPAVEAGFLTYSSPNGLLADLQSSPPAGN